MKDLMTQRLVFSIFMTLILTFGIQGITDVLIPEAIALQTPKPPKLKLSYEDNTVPVAAQYNSIAISEIMYATNSGKLPQWIELHNRSRRKVNLEGWKIIIKNHPEDTSVLATKLTFTLGAKILDADQVLLLVTEQVPNSGVGTAKGDLPVDRVVILKDLIGGAQGYRLLSQTAFKVTLKAPSGRKTSRKLISDIAGNLGEIPEWKLPRIEGNQRSSIIREYDGNTATGHPYDGTRADGWELTAKKDSRYAIRHNTYYGHRNDQGTPGYRARAILPVKLSDLPVKLSRFFPRRARLTGQVLISWTTEAEMNNIGFNIKRSTTKNGKFKVINPAVIPGAGKTGERQTYTYTDTTAKPRVVYYYQLECVSGDGTRRTLTLPTRLRGHIGSIGPPTRFLLKSRTP
ncbi:MAG: lamin tail domain-containing protein [Candidatus Poribacteria bacterium]|nr:lamin tail domain-containing protein [Candidatus Poribacteria bacterium]